MISSNFARLIYISSPISFSFQFNFVGRILGPRGMTAKQLEQETGCKIMVRGKGSMRDKKKVSASFDQVDYGFQTIWQETWHYCKQIHILVLRPLAEHLNFIFNYHK